MVGIGRMLQTEDDTEQGGGDERIEGGHRAKIQEETVARYSDILRSCPVRRARFTVARSVTCASTR
jgi:hypothetical protein